MYQVDFDEKAYKEWKKLPSSVRNQFEKKIRELIKGNPQQDGKRLKGSLKDYYKLKAQNFRLVYKVEKEELVIFVVAVGKRENEQVYSKAKKRTT